MNAKRTVSAGKRFVNICWAHDDRFVNADANRAERRAQVDTWWTHVKCESRTFQRSLKPPKIVSHHTEMPHFHWLNMTHNCWIYFYVWLVRFIFGTMANALPSYLGMPYHLIYTTVLWNCFEIRIFSFWNEKKNNWRVLTV